MNIKITSFFLVVFTFFFMSLNVYAIAAESSDQCYSYVQTDYQQVDPDNIDSDFQEVVVDATPVPDTIAPYAPDQFYAYLSNDLYKKDVYSYMLNMTTNEEETISGANLEEQKNSQQKSGKPVIAWGAVSDAGVSDEDGKTYQIQLSDGTFTYGNEIKGYRVAWSTSLDVDMERVGIFQTDSKYQVSLLTKSGTYYLHVQAVDACGNYSNTSTFTYTAKSSIPKFSPSLITDVPSKAGIYHVGSVLSVNLTFTMVYPDDPKTKIRARDLYYRLGNTGKFKKIKGWNSKKITGTTIKLKPGKHTLQYYAMDNAGLYKSSTRKVKLTVQKK